VQANTSTIGYLPVVASAVGQHFARFLNHLNPLVSNLLLAHYGQKNRGVKYQITRFGEYAGRCLVVKGQKL
jgi:hypothetical protein